MPRIMRILWERREENWKDLLSFEVLVYILVIADDLGVCLDDANLGTRMEVSCVIIVSMMLPTAGTNSNTWPEAMDPSPMAILAIFTGGFWRPKYALSIYGYGKDWAEERDEEEVVATDNIYPRIAFTSEIERTSSETGEDFNEVSQKSELRIRLSVLGRSWNNGNSDKICCHLVVVRN